MDDRGGHCRNPLRHVQNPGAKNMTFDAMPRPTHWSLQPPGPRMKLLGRPPVARSRAEESECNR
jgi:hypothetical protein